MLNNQFIARNPSDYTAKEMKALTIFSLKYVDLQQNVPSFQKYPQFKINLYFINR